MFNERDLMVLSNKEVMNFILTGRRLDATKKFKEDAQLGLKEAFHAVKYVSEYFAVEINRWVIYEEEFEFPYERESDAIRLFDSVVNGSLTHYQAKFYATKTDCAHVLTEDFDNRFWKEMSVVIKIDGVVLDVIQTSKIPNFR